MQEHTLTLNNKEPGSLEITLRRSATLVVVLAMLALINYITMPQYLWVKWPALGISLAILGLWAAWLSGHHPQADAGEPDNLSGMFKVSGILVAAAVGMVILNPLVSPMVFWAHMPAICIGLTLVILWVRYFYRKRR